MNKSEERVIEGRIYVLGDHVDTDQIIPAEYLNLVPTIAEEYEKLGSYALCGLPDANPPFVTPGKIKTEFSILIAGRNFGCGSSREHAPVALGAAGVRIVIAQSYARIFFRNAVATGEIYPCETDERLCETLHTGMQVQVDLNENCLRHNGDAARTPLKPLGAVAPVIEAGGIFEYARATGMIGEKDQPRP